MSRVPAQPTSVAARPQRLGIAAGVLAAAVLAAAAAQVERGVRLLDGQHGRLLR